MAENRWKILDEMSRPELKELHEHGYKFENPWEIIDIFEKKVAEHAGSKYAVAVDCCSHALFLCLMLRKEQWEMVIGTLEKGKVVEIPKHTWFSVPMQIELARLIPLFRDVEWECGYWLEPWKIWDGAVRWQKGMYMGELHCLSFQIKKNIPIGKGGMILTDSKEEQEILKLMRYDGRDMNTHYMDPGHIKRKGWHMYMTPEDAARGIMLMDAAEDNLPDSATYRDYQDLSKFWTGRGCLL